MRVTLDPGMLNTHHQEEPLELSILENQTPNHSAFTTFYCQEAQLI